MNFEDIPISDIKEFLEYNKMILPKIEPEADDLRKQAFELMKIKDILLPPSIYYWLIAFHLNKILVTMDNSKPIRMKELLLKANFPLLEVEEQRIVASYLKEAVVKEKLNHPVLIAELRKKDIYYLKFAEMIIEYKCPEDDNVELNEIYERDLNTNFYSALLLINLFSNLPNVCVGIIIMIAIKDNKVMDYEMIDFNLTRCELSKYRFVVCLITLVSKDIEFGHANCAIIDTKLKTVEIFDPNGDAKTNKSVVTVINSLFADFLPQNYQYLATVDICPYTPPQKIAREPICEAFVQFYILLRVYNPTLYPKTIFELLSELNNTQLRELMRQYLCYTFYYSKENEIDKTVKTMVNLYNQYNKNNVRLPNEIYQFYLKNDWKTLEAYLK